MTHTNGVCCVRTAQGRYCSIDQKSRKNHWQCDSIRSGVRTTKKVIIFLMNNTITDWEGFELKSIFIRWAFLFQGECYSIRASALERVFFVEEKDLCALRPHFCFLNTFHEPCTHVYLLSQGIQVSKWFRKHGNCYRIGKYSVINIQLHRAVHGPYWYRLHMPLNLLSCNLNHSNDDDL